MIRCELIDERGAKIGPAVVEYVPQSGEYVRLLSGDKSEEFEVQEVAHQLYRGSPGSVFGQDSFTAQEIFIVLKGVEDE